jgi:superfamily II DNA or RNA helicase
MSESPRLYDWQLRALDAWRANNRRGVVQATTGAGKTRLAVAAIEDVWQLDSYANVAVVVPTKVLARQWHGALAQELGVSREDVRLPVELRGGPHLYFLMMVKPRPRSRCSG